LASLGPLDRVLGFRLRRIQTHLAKTLANRLAQAPATAGLVVRTGEFSALTIIAANPGISQIQLAHVGGFDKTSVVAMVDDMEARGWASRRRAPEDRRRHTLHVTPAGEAMLEVLSGIAQANEARINQALSAQERGQLYELLDRIYEACVAEDPAVV
jgi:DNA-binding MarR family transcriptional regulator